jgi:cyclohexa-1,5-dienecarbonyl-CoA hydratase
LTRLTVAFKAPVAQIMLDHAPVNVIDIAMMEELNAVLKGLEQHPGISTIVLCGNEKAFSAGVDISIHTPEHIEEMLTKFHAVIRVMANSPKILIGVVRGSCLGGGAELAMMCDMVYTATNAVWQFPEIKLGCFPPVAAAGLAALVGQKKAADLILTGRRFRGEDAEKMGLANEAIPEVHLERRVQEVTTHLATLSPAALAVTKKALYAWDSMHLDKGLARAEKIYLEELMKTEDAQEGVRAWMDGKRKPVWKGE